MYIWYNFLYKRFMEFDAEKIFCEKTLHTFKVSIWVLEKQSLQFERCVVKKGLFTFNDLLIWPRPTPPPPPPRMEQG